MVIKCTIGANGQEYYFNNGKRITVIQAKKIDPNIKCISKERKKASIRPIKVTKPKKSYKPCKDHQYRDPETHRCRNKMGEKPVKKPSTKQKTYKPCKDHQYRDPETHRCKNKPDYKLPKKPKISKKEPVRVEPEKRWKRVKKVIDDCVKRSKLPLRDLQIKVVQYMENHRALLVVHGTGTGKTLTAITVSQCYLDQNSTKNVVFVGPASLISNFKKELIRYGLKDMSKYTFYSFDKFYIEAKANRPINLKNTMLIVDEAHNLRNPKSKKSYTIVQASFNADKVLLLTATPFVNNLMDFIPLINMTYGRNIVGTAKDFYEGHVEEGLGKKATQENLTTLKYLLRDKVDVVTLKNTVDFPTRVDHIRNVPMTKDYYERYIRIIAGERVFGILFLKPEAFYNGYRRAVNRAGPQYYSMKINYALPILKKGKSIVYTNWIDFGIRPITTALKNHNLSYRTFYGDVSLDERQKIINQFNNNEFQILILTKAGGEGIDLKGVRSVVVMDPTWNDAGLQQIIGRAIRYKSHAHLPISQRKVDVYFMILIPPENISKGVPSGDILLYEIIQKKNEINAAVIAIIEDMSI
jgi:superfamily II DNA or RNA helicase